MHSDQQLDATTAGPEERSPVIPDGDDAHAPAAPSTVLDRPWPDSPGATLVGQAPDPGPVHPADGERRRGRWRLPVAYAVVAVLLVTAAVVGVSSHRHLARTAQSLEATRAEVRRTVARVAVARSELATLTGQSAAAGATLANESAQLAGDQSRLAAAEATVHANGVSIADLDTCLAGVEKALNQVSLSDQAGAATTLDGVSASCQGAEPS